MVEDNKGIGIAGMCCCFLIVVVLFFGLLGGNNSSTSAEIVVDDNLPEEETLPILNMTNVTLNASKITFVYYDHNSSVFEGCYGLNYSVLSDKLGNSYMLDHATTDIFGERTNYTFRYPNGIGLVFDNRTDTEIYNRSQLYYVHELRDDNGEVVKPLGNFTLYDKSHEPTFIPTNWTFVYIDHNSTRYEGDDGLSEAVTANAIGNHEQNVRFSDEVVIGLMYYSNNSTDFYRYGFNGFGFDDLENYHVNGTSANGYYDHGYYLSQFSPSLPNGTEIRSFNIETNYLSSAEKNFLQDYLNRRDEYLKRQEINAIYDAEDDEYNEYIRYNENQNNKHRYSTYYGTNGYGVIRY